jgi:hypothetical protein
MASSPHFSQSDQVLQSIPASTNDKGIHGFVLQWGDQLKIGGFSTDLCGMKGHWQAHP